MTLRFLSSLLIALLIACGGGGGGTPPAPPSGGGGGSTPTRTAVPGGIFTRPPAPAAAPAIVSVPDPIMLVNQLDATQSDFQVVFPSLGQTYGRIALLSDGTIAFTGTDWISRPNGTKDIWSMSGTWNASGMTIVTPEGTWTFAKAPTPNPPLSTLGTYVCTDSSTGLVTTLTLVDGRNIALSDSTRNVVGAMVSLSGGPAIYHVEVFSDDTRYHSQFGFASYDDQGRLTLMVANTVDAKAGAFYGVFTKQP